MKKSKSNADLRAALAKAGICQWELADMLGTTEWTLSRWLRQELPADQKAKILDLIANAKGL